MSDRGSGRASISFSVGRGRGTSNRFAAAQWGAALEAVNIDAVESAVGVRQL